MTKLKSKPFNELVSNLVGHQLLFPLGFEFARGTFSRELPNGVLHLIMFDHIPERGNFRVMVGVNARPIAPSKEAHLVGTHSPRFLTRRGLSGVPIDFDASEKGQAEHSLEQVRAQIATDVIPWLDRHESLQVVADDLPQGSGLLKAKLLIAAGDTQSAERYLREHRELLTSMPSSNEVVAELAEVNALLGECTQ